MERTVKIFLDTANVESIAKAAKSGIVGGITTNPSILSKEGRSFKESINLICKTLPDGELLFEVMAIDTKGMIEEAHHLTTLSEQVVVKIPMTPEGIAAVSQLSKEGIPCAVTLVFTASQALTAACAGAKYVAPFVGRLDDLGADGIELVANIKKIFVIQNIETQVLAASIRNARTVEHLFSVGCDIVTMPINIYEALFKHSLTDSGLQQFIEDAKKVPSAALV
jgi:transaldolase